jgi:hypothetical protein
MRAQCLRYIINPHYEEWDNRRRGVYTNGVPEVGPELVQYEKDQEKDARSQAEVEEDVLEDKAQSRNDAFGSWMCDYFVFGSVRRLPILPYTKYKASLSRIRAVPRAVAHAAPRCPGRDAQGHGLQDGRPDREEGEGNHGGERAPVGRARAGAQTSFAGLSELAPAQASWREGRW